MLDKQPKRKSLTDILRGGGNGADWINNDWGGIPPAPDFGTPVPKGPYITHIIDGALFNAKTGTPGYKVTHEIIEGEHRGRRLWHDIWLSGAAQRGAVRDLAKLGITNKEKLQHPIPTRRIRCKVFVVVRQADDGTERNEVRSFEVLGIDPPEQNAFAPADGSPPEADAGNPDSPFGANAAPSGPSAEGRQ
jgi:hypothetical protein